MGYMVCYSCGGYYQLKPGESFHQYKHCFCGGNLKYYSDIEVPSYKNENKVGVLRKKIKPKGYHETSQEILRDKIRLSKVNEELNGSISENTELKWGLKDRIFFDGLIFIVMGVLFIPAVFYHVIFPIMALAIIVSSFILIIISQKKVYKKKHLQIFYVFNASIFSISCFISIIFIILTLIQLNPLIYSIIDYSYFNSAQIFSPISLAIISGVSAYYAINRAALPEYDEKPPLGTAPQNWGWG